METIGRILGPHPTILRLLFTAAGGLSAARREVEIAEEPSTFSEEVEGFGSRGWLWDLGLDFVQGETFSGPASRKAC